MPAERVVLDAKAFARRINLLYSHWKADSSEEAFQGAKCLLILVGNSDGEMLYLKSTSLHTWLFGYEFPNTLLLFTPDRIHIVASVNKGNILESLSADPSANVKLKIYKRAKDVEENMRIFSQVADVIKASGKVGVPKKDQSGGPFLKEWTTFKKENNFEYEEVDCSVGLAMAMAVKEDEELLNIRAACKITSIVMKKYFIEEMLAVVDEDRKITHEALSEKTENVLADPDIMRKFKLSADIDKESIDWCYTPIVQSGGKFDLRASASSNDDHLHGGTILCSMGLRYKNYCSNIGRTFMIDPTSAQEKNYAFLLELQHRMVENVIRDGVTCAEVYTKALNYVKNTRPDLEKHFLKNCGFGMGIEFRESALSLNAKNSRVLKKGMVLNLCLGLQDLENAKAKDPENAKYAVLLVDTVVVNENKASIMTDVPKLIDDVAYYFKDNAEEKEEKEKPSSRAEPERVTTSKSSPAGKSTSTILKSKFRSEDQTEAKEKSRLEHQKLLFEKRQLEGEERFAEGKMQTDDTARRQFRKFQSYVREDQIPRDTEKNQIFVDKRNSTILLPIYGMVAPFHISVLKNVSKGDEGDFCTLRFNFVTPGQGGAKKEEQNFDDLTANYVRSVVYRSADIIRLNNIFKEIQDLKKNIAKQEAERKERADIVIQRELIPFTNRRPPRLPNVFARPTADSKRFAGDLEIHKNGIRYQSSLKSDNKIDILFENMRHVFLQTCEHELLALIHIHLHNPIMIGKKKATDVQFFREASDAQFDETGNRRRRMQYGDDDELEAENEERRRRNQLNKEFQDFSLKLEEMRSAKVEVPCRELGFSGVPFRTNVLLQPTENCLVHLSDAPFLVITNQDIELVHLERVQFGLKNFDMVFIYRDYTKTPIHINAVPMDQLDNVKDWLDSMDMPYTEGPMNLNWTAIMKTINEDPKSFFQDGGWSFLKTASDVSEEETDESASEFEVSGEDEFSASSDYSSEQAETSGSEDESDFSGSNETGEDWDELEMKAKNQDDGLKGVKRKVSGSVGGGGTNGSNKKARR